MRKLIHALLLVAAFGAGFAGYEYLKQLPTAAEVQQIVEIKTSAFRAAKQDGLWVLNLNPQYNTQGKSVAITYRDTFYGVYLLADTIYLPVLVPDDAELVITSLDRDGNPVTTESFRIGEQHVSENTSTTSGH
jgi:hypothetical protein